MLSSLVLLLPICWKSGIVNGQPSPTELAPLYQGLAHRPAHDTLEPRVPLSTDDRTRAPLVDLQVYAPAVTPSGLGCVVELLKWNFGADSYGKPAVVPYVPPTKQTCGTPGGWSAVTMNLTVYSNGTQYDRLSVELDSSLANTISPIAQSLYLNHVEIWRHSSAEPTKTGTIWSIVKDVTHYIPLLSSNGTLLMDFSNIISAEYALDGVFDVTLTATYYPVAPDFEQAGIASSILPLSNLSPNTTNLFALDSDVGGVTLLTIPPTTQQAFVEIKASGNSAEEFWYSNALDSALKYFKDPTVVTAKGPWREVRVLVDSKLAGVVWPYAVIYTGGITPTNWRPLASFGVYDQPAYFVDVTPFVPLLTDGKVHNITLSVHGQGGDGPTINSNWFVSGALHIVTGKTRVQGKITVYQASDPSISDKAWSDDGNVTVEQSVYAQRKLVVQAELKGDAGEQIVRFEQSLGYSNNQAYSDGGWVQWTSQRTVGTTTSTHGKQTVLRDAFDYPLGVFSNYTLYSATANAAYNSAINQTHIRAHTPPFGRTSTLMSIQHARGSVGLDAWPGLRHAVNGTGATDQSFAYMMGDGDSYFRQLAAVNDGWVSDAVWGTLRDVEGPVPRTQIWRNGSGPGF